MFRLFCPFRGNHSICSRNKELKTNRTMITLFLIIAFCIRKRFVRENACWSDKLLYYGFSVVLTPLFGPRLYKSIIEAPPADPNEPSTGIYSSIGF